MARQDRRHPSSASRLSRCRMTMDTFGSDMTASVSLGGSSQEILVDGDEPFGHPRPVIGLARDLTVQWFWHLLLEEILDCDLPCIIIEDGDEPPDPVPLQPLRRLADGGSQNWQSTGHGLHHGHRSALARGH